MLIQYYVYMDMRIVIGICAVAVLVVIGLVAWRAVARYRASREIFLKFDTMAGPLRVYTIRRDDDWVRVMDVQGTMQSATYLDDWRCYDLVYDYTKQYDHLFEAGKPEHGVLVLGGGGYSYPKHLISNYDDVAVEVVEIDPTVTSIAQRYFFLDRLIVEFETEENGRLELICDEARHFLESTDKRYSAIVNDCFSGLHFAESLATLEAAQLYRDHLVEGGVYLSNVISAVEGDRSHMINRIVATLDAVFKNVYVIAGQPEKPENYDNNIVIATDGDYVFSGIYPFIRDLGTNILLDENAVDENWTVPIAN